MTKDELKDEVYVIDRELESALGVATMAHHYLDNLMKRCYRNDENLETIIDEVGAPYLQMICAMRITREFFDQCITGELVISSNNIEGS